MAFVQSKPNRLSRNGKKSGVRERDRKVAYIARSENRMCKCNCWASIFVFAWQLGNSAKAAKHRTNDEFKSTNDIFGTLNESHYVGGVAFDIHTTQFCWKYNRFRNKCEIVLTKSKIVPSFTIRRIRQWTFSVNVYTIWTSLNVYDNSFCKLQYCSDKK